MIRKQFFTLIFLTQSLSAQLRVGDPGVLIDENKFDPNYPAMTEWATAGVEGGIPFLSDSPPVKTIESTNSGGLNQAILLTAAQGGGQLLLKNGTYTIDKTVSVRSQVRLVGESKDGVLLNITMRGTSGSAIHFAGIQNAGIENLTLIGDGDGLPPDFEMRDAMPDFIITSVYFGGGSKNCWINNCKLINSGSNAVSIWNSSHITVRDCYVERAYNKGSGGHGYVQFSGSYCLMHNTVVKKMRHIIIQREYCKYNVFYQNKVEQDFNFHNADAGYNLVEQNIVTLPAGLDDGWHAMMTPWSVEHNAPGPGSVIYRNQCVEHNNGGKVDFSDHDKVWIPKGHYQAFTISDKTPLGGTFYPVENVKDVTWVVDNPALELPDRSGLLANYANPFNPSTVIGYRITSDTIVELSILNSLGQVIRLLENKDQPAGHYQVFWDGRDHLGRAAPSGIYFCRLITENTIVSRKLMLLK